MLFYWSIGTGKTTTPVTEAQWTPAPGPRQLPTSAPNRSYLWVVVVGVLSLIIAIPFVVALLVSFRRRWSASKCSCPHFVV